MLKVNQVLRGCRAVNYWKFKTLPFGLNFDFKGRLNRIIQSLVPNCFMRTSSSINLLFFFRNTFINATSPVWDFAIIKSSSLIFSIHTVFANMQNCWQILLFSISHFKPWLQCWIKRLIFNAARPQSIYV